MGGAAPVEVSVLAAASQPNQSSSSTSSTSGQSPRRSATAPDPPSPRRSGGSGAAPAAPTDVVLSALSSSPPSTSNSITSMSSGSSSSHRSSSPVGSSADRSPLPSRNNVFRQYFRGRQRRPADAPAPLAGSGNASNNGNNSFSSGAPGSPVVGGSPSKASPSAAANGAAGNTSGGAWQRLAAWRKNKRDSMGNNLKAKSTSSASSGGSGETFAISDADAGDPSLDAPNRRTMIWCVGDLVVNVSIGRKTTIPELRDCLAGSAKAADFELPPSFVLAVERDRSIVLLSELFSPATLAFDIDTQFLVDGVEFRYLVLPEKFHELFEADAID